MSDRRAMRAARAVRRPTDSGPGRMVEAIRAPVGDLRWRDSAWLAENFPAYFDERARARLAMGARVDNYIRGRWAVDHGFGSENYPQHPDWRRLAAYLREDTR